MRRTADPVARDVFRFTVIAFVVLATVAYVAGQVAMSMPHYSPLPHEWPDHAWIDGYARFDSGWYHHIATRGYFYDGPDQQSAVAFFPVYPALMRILGYVLVDEIIAGTVITVLSALVAAILFARWCTAAFGAARARLAVAALLLYPFAFYLFGAVYSDALFLAAALGSFVLLEKDRPLLAGLVAAFATATRPVGIALIIGLLLRGLELQGVLGGGRPRLFGAAAVPIDDDARSARLGFFPSGLHLSRLRLHEAPLLLSVLGLMAFCGYLWWRFDAPLAFVEVTSRAPGWAREINLAVIFKVFYFQLLQSYGLQAATFWLGVQGVASLAALASTPLIVRRLGWGYASYVAVSVGVAWVSNSHFIGMGRYVLVAFPFFAVVGDLLARPASSARWRWALVVLAVVAVGFGAWMTGLYARWHYLA